MNFGPMANVNIEAELSDSSMLLTQLPFCFFHSDIFLNNTIIQNCVWCYRILSQSQRIK